MTSELGLDFIKREEGTRTRAYKCPAGVWTIGVGHTGPEVKEGLVWTTEQVDSALHSDLARFEECVAVAVQQSLTRMEFDALVSFAFNVGTGAFKSSTLLKKLNAGDRTGAADEFLRWNKAGGKVLPVLDRRRKRERALFLYGIYG